MPATDCGGAGAGLEGLDTAGSGGDDASWGGETGGCAEGLSVTTLTTGVLDGGDVAAPIPPRTPQTPATPRTIFVEVFMGGV